MPLNSEYGMLRRIDFLKFKDIAEYMVSGTVHVDSGRLCFRIMVINHEIPKLFFYDIVIYQKSL